jgi:murein DD-endopeptidase MepM/ murein hydrolase activator NlpD
MLGIKKIEKLHHLLTKMGYKEEALYLLKISEISFPEKKEIIRGKVINLDSGNELRIRSEPNTDSRILDELSNGDEFEFLEEEKNKFIKVKAKGTEGWIHSNYAEYYGPDGNVIFKGQKTTDLESDKPPDEERPQWLKDIIDSIFNPQKKRDRDSEFKITEKIDSAPTSSEGSGKISSPTSGGVIYGSKFGMRLHPIHKKWKMHGGLDIKASSGQPLFAIEDGTIVRNMRDGGGGNIVSLKGKTGRIWTYMHLKSPSPRKVGEEILSGEEIGSAGQTGTATGPHLHLSLKMNSLSSSNIDPLPALQEIGISCQHKSGSKKKSEEKKNS